jgi:cyclopropane-fatty-acyl-phospholipid synthase
LSGGIVITETVSPPLKRRRIRDWANAAARRMVLARLAGITDGQIIVREGPSEFACGKPADLHGQVTVCDPAVYRRAALGGSLALAEAYIAGDWDCDDLPTVLRIFARNAAAASRMETGLLAKLVNLGRRRQLRRRDNSLRGSKRNIIAHYDLGNEFFRLWLDETMAYSSGVFPALNASLEEASLEKFDRVCRKLDLQDEDRVIEIGGGWGGFAAHAASHYGCHVTSTTISPAQFDYASQAIAERGLQHRIALLNQDYRTLAGQFDKLVSIEMIEAVGHHRLDEYFSQCSRLLTPAGSMVIQAIVMPEQGYARYLNTVDFIKRHIFPGGCLPSLGSILESVGRATDLRVVHVEDFAPHYAETLRRWRQAFTDRLDEVRALGCTEQFIRSWDFYLCSCEAAFEERTIGVVQIQFDKPRCRRESADLSSRVRCESPYQLV